MDRGVARFREGDGEFALTDFKKAAELNPDCVEARLSLASALASEGRIAQALAEADRAAHVAKAQGNSLYARILALQVDLRKAKAGASGE